MYVAVVKTPVCLSGC